MRRFLGFSILMLNVGCRACPAPPVAQVEDLVQSVAAERSTPNVIPCAATMPIAVESADMASLWSLALAYNPELREAASEVEASRGQLIQAGKYPNPRFLYSEETIGNSTGPPGALKFEVSQEVVTGGKRRLDMAIASQSLGSTRVALLTRKLDLLTRFRRTYYDYQNWQYTLRVNQEIVETLEQGVAITRVKVEKAGTRPRSDLLRLEALLKEARIALTSNRASLEASWKQLAAEIGLPTLPLPAKPQEQELVLPSWEFQTVIERVQSSHTSLKQATMELERAHLEVERARAEAVPNVTLGAGYSHEYVDRVQGAIINAETAIPVWDRKQGHIHEAEARWARAQAAQRTAATHLSRDTAEAFGRYVSARQQLEQLSKEVLPTWRESLESLRKQYQAGSTEITFADVLQAQVSTNETQLKIADARRALWQAIADLQGLMQLDLGEEAHR